MNFSVHFLVFKQLLIFFMIQDQTWTFSFNFTFRLVQLAWKFWRSIKIIHYFITQPVRLKPTKSTADLVDTSVTFSWLKLKQFRWLKLNQNHLSKRTLVETNSEMTMMSSLNNETPHEPVCVCPSQSLTLCFCESVCGKGQKKTS